MLNTTRKLVSVKRDRLSLCFKTTTVFVFLFVLATVGYAVHGVFQFFLSKYQPFGRSNESPWSHTLPGVVNLSNVPIRNQTQSNSNRSIDFDWVR